MAGVTSFTIFHKPLGYIRRVPIMGHNRHWFATVSRTQRHQLFGTLSADKKGLASANYGGKFRRRTNASKRGSERKGSNGGHTFNRIMNESFSR